MGVAYAFEHWLPRGLYLILVERNDNISVELLCASTPEHRKETKGSRIKMDLEHETTSILLQKLENKYNYSATLLDKNIEDQRVELINAISDLTTKMDDR